MKELDMTVARAQKGDAAAFEQLVVTYRDQVFRLALRMCGNETDADEAAQDAFLSAWKGLPNFRGDSRFSTWLYQLTTHAAIDLLRRQKRRGETDDITEISVADSAPGPQQQAEQSETRQAVRDAMAQLTPEYRQIVVLRFLQEIAAALKLPPGTVKSRLNRAKAQLRGILAGMGNLFDAGSVIHTEQTGKEARP